MLILSVFMLEIMGMCRREHGKVYNHSDPFSSKYVTLMSEEKCIRFYFRLIFVATQTYFSCITVSEMEI